MSSPVRKLLWAILAILGACLPAIWIFQKAALNPSVLMGPTATDPYFNLYVLEWGAKHWERGFSGYWSAPFFFPTPWVTTLSDHLLLPAALFRLFQSLGAAPALGYNLLLLLSFGLTAVSVYLLFRKASRAPNFVCVCASVIVALAPWRLGQLTHLQMLWAPGPPLLFLTVDAFLRRPRPGRALAAIAALSVTLFSGCYLAYFSVLLATGQAAYSLARRKVRARLLSRWPSAALLAFVSFALLLTVFAPYWIAKQELGTERSSKDYESYGAEAKDWLAPSSINAYSSILPPDWVRPERNLFPGWSLSMGLLVFLALRTSRRERKDGTALGNCLLWGAVAFSILELPFAFGALSHVLPGLDGMRVPPRAHFFVLLGIGMAGVSALKAALAGSRPRWHRTVAAVVFLATAATDLSLRALPAGAYFSPEPPGQMPRYVGLLRDSNVGAIAIFPLRGTHEDIPRMWRGLVHGKPIANGYSGYLSDSFRYLKRACQFPGRKIGNRCVAAMNELKLTHFLVESFDSEATSLDLRAAAIVKPGTAGVEPIYYDSGVVAFSIHDK